jgi:hypothetical protein
MINGGFSLLGVRIGVSIGYFMLFFLFKTMLISLYCFAFPHGVSLLSESRLSSMMLNRDKAR